MDADNVGSVLPEGGNKPVAGVAEELNHVVVEGVHVFHQPLVTAVIHLLRRKEREDRRREGC